MRCINRPSFTLIELMVCVVLTSILGSALYLMVSSAQKSLRHGYRSVEILQACSLIMSRLRKELRESPDTPAIINSKLLIKINDKLQRLYYYDPKKMALYVGERTTVSMDEPMVGQELLPYKFNNGQIVDFTFDSSDRGEAAWLINEMSINNKYWFKVEMDVIFSKEWDKMNEAERQKILMDPTQRRRFSITITPRHKNWILQNSQ